jgi:mono/diheme cytochrome c family protein
MLVMGVTSAAAAGQKSVAQGHTYYLRYCASCHGENGNGQGPMASSLKQQPADLRLLSEKYGNPLSVERVAAFVDGREAVAAHGSREMPVWGERLYDIWNAKGSPGGMPGRIKEIVLYLRTIQLKTPPGNPIAGGDTAAPH